jgi:hypothetical protein
MTSALLNTATDRADTRHLAGVFLLRKKYS